MTTDQWLGGSQDLEEVRTWRESGLGGRWRSCPQSPHLEERGKFLFSISSLLPLPWSWERGCWPFPQMFWSLLFPTLVDLFSAVAEVLGQKKCFVYIFQDTLRELITILYVLPVFTLHPNPWDINYVSKMAIPKGLNYLNYLFCTQGLLQNNLFAF